MSEIRLTESVAGLEAASKAAAKKLGLEQGEFTLFKGLVRHPTRPQKIVKEGDTYLDKVFFFGRTVNNMIGEFNFGDMLAFIDEPLPRRKHQADVGESPILYAPRWLTYKDGVITVESPSNYPPKNQGPVVTELAGNSPRFNEVTLYDTKTGVVKVHGGRLYPYEHVLFRDITVEIDASDLPEYIVAPRIATLDRAINTTATIFEKITRQDPSVEVIIEKD